MTIGKAKALTNNRSYSCPSIRKAFQLWWKGDQCSRELPRIYGLCCVVDVLCVVASNHEFGGSRPLGEENIVGILKQRSKYASLNNINHRPCRRFISVFASFWPCRVHSPIRKDPSNGVDIANPGHAQDNAEDRLSHMAPYGFMHILKIGAVF